MLNHRAFPFRWWVELLAWVALAGLFLAIQLLPIPESQRMASNIALCVVGLYTIACFRLLFPRFNYAPRLIYLTLIIDVFIVGVFRLLFISYFPDIAIGFMPLIMVSAFVADRRGVLALAGTAVLVDLVARLTVAPLSLVMLVNQFAVALMFITVGLSFSFLGQAVRTRTEEMEELRTTSAAVELALRNDAEHALQHWQTFNNVSVRVEQETTPERIYEVVAKDLHALQLDFFVSVWQIPGETLQVDYISLPADKLALLRDLVGHPLSDYPLDVHKISVYQDCLRQRRGVLTTAGSTLVRQALPALTDEVLARVVTIAGLDQFVVAPIIAGDQITGFFQVWGHAISAADTPALAGLAQQIGIALEKGHLLERERKRAAQLAFVSEIAERAVGLLDADELLNEVTRLMVLRFQFENVSILTVDTVRRELLLAAHAGQTINWQQIGYRQSWDVGLLGHAVRRSISVVVNDVRNDPRYFTDEPDDVCRSELVIPLKRRNQVLGVLDVQSTTLNAFDPTDVIALETLASLLAAAIEKSEMFARERKRAAHLAMVSAIAESATATLDADRLLQSVVHLICERFGYYSVNVMLLNPNTEELEMHASFGGYQELFGPDYVQKLTVGLIGRAAMTGRTVVCNDANREKSFYFPEGHSPTALSEMCVPLKIGSRLLGVFDVHDLPADAFDASDVTAMETLANQIAIALENARLYEQTKGEAEVKAALLRELSHRVKNNLAAIVGLLYLGLDDETLPRQEILSETLTRVQSMMVAHNMLATSPDARVELSDLGSRVVQESVRYLTMPGQLVSWDVTGDTVEITAQQASSLALVLNELVTNAIKHGRSVRKELRLHISREGAWVRLDWSCCMPEDTPTSADLESGGLGQELVRTLVEKDLRGSLSMQVFPEQHTVRTEMRFEPGN